MPGVGGPGLSGSAAALGGGAGGLSGGGAIGGEGGGEGRRVVEPLCLAWCTSAVEAPMLVVGMADGGVHVWRHDDSGWASVVSLSNSGGGRCHADSVRSVSWSADMGRSYQLVATGSRDKTVKLWALQRQLTGDEDDDEWGRADAIATDAPLDGKWSARCVAELTHRSQVAQMRSANDLMLMRC